MTFPPNFDRGYHPFDDPMNYDRNFHYPILPQAGGRYPEQHSNDLEYQRALTHDVGALAVQRQAEDDLAYYLAELRAALHDETPEAEAFHEPVSEPEPASEPVGKNGVSLDSISPNLLGVKSDLPPENIPSSCKPPTPRQPSVEVRLKSGRAVLWQMGTAVKTDESTATKFPPYPEPASF